jgi:hypothetical protein
MLNTIAAVLGIALAFSSMLLSWYILVPRKKANYTKKKFDISYESAE